MAYKLSAFPNLAMKLMYANRAVRNFCIPLPPEVDVLGRVSTYQVQESCFMLSARLDLRTALSTVHESGITGPALYSAVAITGTKKILGPTLVGQVAWHPGLSPRNFQ